MGRDDADDAEMRRYVEFQSTRPVWGATMTPQKAQQQIEISIHAPRVGRDRVYLLIEGAS